MPLSPADLDELRALLGEDGVMASDAARFAYEADAMMHARHRPDAIVLPRTTDEVAAIVRWAAARALPVTPRGAGTGLAGGATTEQAGLSLSLNRMDQVLRVDEARMTAWVQPGLVNLWLSQQLAPRGLYFAPIPPRSRSPRSAATSRRMRVDRTASSTASRSITSSAARWCSPTARWSRSVARRSMRRTPISCRSCAAARARARS
jgi:hypothetical protein